MAQAHTPEPKPEMSVPSSVTSSWNDYQLRGGRFGFDEWMRKAAQRIGPDGHLVQPDSAPPNATRVPNHRSAEIAGRGLHLVDLAGGATTASDYELKVGIASLTNAYRGGFTPTPGTSSVPSLLEAYRRYEQRLDAAELAKGRQPKLRTHAEVEARALAKSLRKVSKKLAQGKAQDTAHAHGFVTYKEVGGKLGPQSWLRKAKAK